MKKSTFVLFIVVSLIVSLVVVSCAKKQAEQTPAPEVVNTAVKQPEPEVKPVEVKQEPVVVKEEPVVIVKEEPAAPAAPVASATAEPVFQPVKYKISYGNITADAVFNETEGEIAFSKGVTADQISLVISEIVKAYPQLAKSGLKYSVSGNPVKVTLTYPKGSSVSDLEYWYALIAPEFDSAVKKYFASAAPAAEPISQPVRYKIAYGDITADAVFNETKGEIAFSKGVTADQISIVISEIVKAYPQLAKSGLKYSVSGNPVKVSLTYPKGSSVADLEYWFGLIAPEFDNAVKKYMASIAPATPAAEPVVVTPVVVTPVAEPAAPAAEPVVEEKFAVDNNIRFSITPINFRAKHKGFDYSFGASVSYEMRLESNLGFGVTADYNLYFDDDDKDNYTADHALYLDIVEYTPVSEKCSMFFGFGPGADLFVTNKAAKVNAAFRTFLGVDCRLNDLVSLQASTGVEVAFHKDAPRICLKPVQIGVQFTL